MNHATTEHSIGLRFDRSQATALKRIAQHLRSDGSDAETVGLFDRAADSARSGEPLIVICSDPIEVALMAAAFPRWGIAPPAIEALSNPGGGPSPRVLGDR